MTLLRLLALAATAALSLVLSVLWLALALWLGAEAMASRRPGGKWRRLSRRWLSWDPVWTWRWAWHLGKERAVEFAGPVRQRVYRSARERAALVELLRRRDGDDCQLCFRPLDFDAPQSDPWAEEVDHIVPFSLGGDCHVDNFQLAHRYCNQAKGNRFDQPGRAA